MPRIIQHRALWTFQEFDGLPVKILLAVLCTVEAVSDERQSFTLFTGHLEAIIRKPSTKLGPGLDL